MSRKDSVLDFCNSLPEESKEEQRRDRKRVQKWGRDNIESTPMIDSWNVCEVIDRHRIDQAIAKQKQEELPQESIDGLRIALNYQNKMRFETLQARLYKEKVLEVRLAFPESSGILEEWRNALKIPGKWFKREYWTPDPEWLEYRQARKYIPELHECDNVAHDRRRFEKEEMMERRQMMLSLCPHTGELLSKADA